MVCRYCLSDKPLGDSHVIPRSFFPKHDPDGRPCRLLSNRTGVHPKKSRIGIYDKTILCKQCEREFAHVDNYAQKLLIEKSRQFGRLFRDEQLVGYEFHHYDYETIKKFFVSILWRAIVSTHPFYHRINAEDIAPKALAAFKGKAAIPAETFSVNLAAFGALGAGLLMDPYLTNFDGIRYAVFYLGGYIAYIKLEDQPTPTGLAELMLAHGRPLSIVARDFIASKEVALATGMVQMPQNRI